MTDKNKVFNLTLEALAAGASETVITTWHVPVGSVVKKDQDLVEVSTDKATFDVPAPCDGVLKSILKIEGSSVGPGESIAEIYMA
jgi:pyruvate/2-oxoglutarate dehydrogenase complex dihydrolipoamide acyltransferase (E2) component